MALQRKQEVRHQIGDQMPPLQPQIAAESASLNIGGSARQARVVRSHGISTSLPNLTGLYDVQPQK